MYFIYGLKREEVTALPIYQCTVKLEILFHTNLLLCENIKDPSHTEGFGNLRQIETDLRLSVARNRKNIVLQFKCFMAITRPIFVVGRSLVMFKILPANEMVVNDLI